jgi:hypothetical protein
MVRIRRSTHRRLRQLGELWHQLSASRQDVPCPNDRDGISLEYVVRTLLERDEAHRRRSRKTVFANRGTVTEGEAGEAQ